MATQVASLFADLSVSDNSAQALAGFEGGLQRAGQKLQTLGADVTKFGSQLVTTFGPFAALFGLSISKFSSFEEAMRNAHSILGTNEEDMQAINDQILDIGANSRAGPQAVAEAYYGIVSGVQDASTHFAILDSAIATSEAGNADLAATTGALIGVMNAYGYSAEDAAFVSDVFTRTVQMGVLTMDELAAAFPNVTGLAAQMGIPLEEVASSLSFMTTQGISASVASTQLRQSVISLINPNTQMAAAIAELGYESGQALIEQEGLVGAMELIGSTSVVADEGIAAVWGSTEALGAAMALTKDQADGFISAFEGMGEMWGGVEFEAPRFGGSGAQAAQDWLDSQGGIGGATSAAQEIQMSGPAAQLDLLRSSVDELAIRIGEALVPALQDIMETVGPVVEDVTEWAAENPKLVSSVGLLTLGLTGLGLILIPIGSLLSVGGTLVSGVAALAGASGFAGMTSALLPLLGPAAILGALVAAYVTDFGGFKTAVDDTVSAIKDGDMAGVIQGVAESMLAIPLGLAIEFGDLVGIDVVGGLRGWAPVIDGVAEAAKWAAGEVGNLITKFGELVGLNNTGISFPSMFDMGFDLDSPLTPTQQVVGNYDESETQDSGGFALAGSMNIIGVGAQPEAFIPTTNGMFVPNIDEILGGGGRGNVTVIMVNNPQFNGVQDVATFYDQMKREGNRRAPQGI